MPTETIMPTPEDYESAIAPNEKTVIFPYLDSKNHITIGTGNNREGGIENLGPTSSEAQRERVKAEILRNFLSVPFRLKIGNQPSKPASQAEVKAEFEKLWAEKLKWETHAAIYYRGITNLVEYRADARRDFANKVAEHSNKAQRIIPNDQWERLTPGQQIAVVDMTYLHGRPTADILAALKEK
jgi:GH24 family phage-related lysozyme (muramidase)